MAEDETETESEDKPVDVKAKLAQMSGTRLRKERAELAADKKTTTGKKKRRREAEDPEEAARIAKKAKEIEEMLAAEPSDPGEEEAAAPAPTPEAKPKPKPKKKRERQLTPVRDDDDGRDIGAPVAFVFGLLGGCLPAIVTLVMGGLSGAAPDGLPAAAVERSKDWIHCSKAVSANQWACDVYDYSGNPIGKGEFVPAVGSKGNDWKILAGKDQLVIDGDYENLLAQSEMVYVKGVAVSSERIWSKK